MPTSSVTVGHDWVELTDRLSNGNWAAQVVGVGSVLVAVAADADAAAAGAKNQFEGGEWFRFGKSSDSVPVWVMAGSQVETNLTVGSINMNDPRPM